MNMTLQAGIQTRIPQTKTFSEAVTSYVKQGGEAKYLFRILPHIGGTILTEIVPFYIWELSKEPEALSLLGSTERQYTHIQIPIPVPKT
jgi:hypothetical protein